MMSWKYCKRGSVMDLLILWSLSLTGDLLPMFSRLAGAEAGAVCLLTTTTGSLVSWMAVIVLLGQLGVREGVRRLVSRLTLLLGTLW